MPSNIITTDRREDQIERGAAAIWKAIGYDTTDGEEWPWERAVADMDNPASRKAPYVNSCRRYAEACLAAAIPPVAPAPNETDAVDKMARAIDPDWWTWYDRHGDLNIEKDVRMVAAQRIRAQRALCAAQGMILDKHGARYPMTDEAIQERAIKLLVRAMDDDAYEDSDLRVRSGHNPLIYADVALAAIRAAHRP
jgi:hypothetical protein